MRRTWVVIVSVAVVAAGCSSDDDDDRAARTPPASSAGSGTGTTSTVPSLSIGSRPCGDIGVAPASAELTWISSGKLFSPAGCLTDVGPDTSIVGWGGLADRVVIDNRVFITGKAPVEPFEGALVLSKPTGSAGLHVTPEGTLLKRTLGGGPATDISFMDHHDEAVYHPAGQHIASSGTHDGLPALMIADNLGANPTSLVRVEEAEGFRDLSFTAAGQLVFVADHRDEWHLHVLHVDAGFAETRAVVAKPATIADVVPSAFGDGIAWTEGQCRGDERPELHLSTTGAEGEVPTLVRRTTPVGWLADGSLAVLDQTSCEPGPGRLYLLRGDEVTFVADDVTSVAVRALLPPPVEPPRSIASEAPA